MRIGYSFWGFLGPGITDTPDGGRSHRRTLIDALLASGHQIVFLQPNRDRDEAATELPYVWESTGLPDIDVLMLEWRWPIPGRNTTPCGALGHTCDLHRQSALVNFYTWAGLPTILWDKDRQLPADDPLRSMANVTICEAALHPSPGAVSLLFPVSDQALDAADPQALSTARRSHRLTYVGNQYDRDACFDAYFAPAALAHPGHLVAGKWTDTSLWPHVTFIGRVPFTQVADLYRASLTTILLLPDRHLASGQMTQRLFEAVLAGCLPLCPAEFRSADQFLPKELIVSSGAEAATLVSHLAAALDQERADLLTHCLEGLDLMRVTRQTKILDQLIASTGHR